MRMPTLTALVAFVALLAAGTAAAEPVVLAIDRGEIYVALGAEDGVGPGSRLELLREIVAKDPRDGTVLRERFAVGTLIVIKSGAHISLVRRDDGQNMSVLAGDQVRLQSPARKFIDPWEAKVAASRPAPSEARTPTGAPAPPIDHVDLAGKAWKETLGQPAEERIERWRALLAEDPRSPYRQAIERELTGLEGQIVQRDAALARARSTRVGVREPRVVKLAAELRAETLDGEDRDLLLVAPLPRVVPEQPISLSFLMRNPAEIDQAWLFVRPVGAPGFQRIELRPDGDAYLRATIEAALVRAPSLEWYVEARLHDVTGAEGAPAAPAVRPVLGSQQAPRVTQIDAVVAEEPIPQGRSHVDAHVDFVDFDGKLGDGFDQYYLAEVDFTYRFLEPVYAVRLGFGSLSGTGGPKDVIDEDPADRCLDEAGVYRCRKVTFSYVYSELELRLSSKVAVLLRPQAGLLTTDSVMDTADSRCSEGADLEGCGFRTRFGGRARLRFGRETGTNLAIGAGFTGGVGTLLEAAYQWFPHPAVPVQLLVQVTDMPVPENLGVRLIGDVGWRQLSWFYPSLRLSYQGRDIDHSGFSGGLAMNFDW